MMIVMLVIGGLFIASRLKGNGETMPLFTPRTPYVPWSENPPSNAGSSGTGETSPLSAVLLRFRNGLSSPMPYVPLSGPGGATTDPGGPRSPSGYTQNTLQAAAPGTLPQYGMMRDDLGNAADPRYWWMMPAVDVAIMSEDVNGAMLAAGDLDLSPMMVEATIGANWR